MRSVLYHALAAERKTVDTSELEQQIDELHELRRANNAELRPILEQILEQKETELARTLATSGLGTLSWNDAICRLMDDASLRRMHRHFRETTYIHGTLEEFANFCLYREFFRRPKRMNSVETMGLISLGYPALEGKTVPSGWPFQREDWSIFLKLVLDFFMRDVSAVDVEDGYLRWMGIPARKRYVQGPGFDSVLTRWQRLWPSMRPKGRPSRIPRILQQAVGLDDSPYSKDKINEVIEHAWTALRPHFQQVGDGYLLKLRDTAVLSELSSGEICPYTARVLDATLNGLSPYQPECGDPEEVSSV